MAALAKLRRAANGVCIQIERGWQNRFLPQVYVPPNYQMDALEKRQLLSIAAHITGPAEVTEGDAYVLSLSASSTADTYTVQNWSISYGDGGSHLLFGDSVADLYTYNTASSPTYDITATVYDLEGTTTYSGSTSMSVTVDEATASLYLSPGEAAAVGQPFDLYEELSDGGAHTLSAYSIAWGDSSSDSDSTTPESITSGYANDFTHTYGAAGTYSVTGTAVTEQGTVTASASIVAEPIWLESPTDGYVAGTEYDLTPTFDDPGHTLGSYIVSWGDGSSDDTYSASATSFGHTYSAGGQNAYEATVQAIADDGTWAAYAEADPLAAVWADNGTTADRGDTIYLDGSFDANGDEPTAWTVDWGDGTTGTYSSSDESFDGQGGIGGPMDATHSYSADGTYTVAAVGTDSVGTYTAQSTTIEVDEPTPTFSVDGDDEFTKGQEYDLTPSFSISSGDTPDNYFVDWGDGSGESTYSGSSTDLAHTYAAGTSTGYTINATVVTDFGTYTDSTSVDETPPTVSISGPGSVTAGQTATFSTSFDDPNGNTPTGWTVYWGDGDEGEGVSGDPSSLTHVYTASPDGGGGWTVMAMASDVDGEYWADDATVGVTQDSATVSIAGDATVTVGDSFAATESFTDAANDTPYNWLVDWGDGSGTYFYNGGSPYLVHSYTQAGSYDVDATAVLAPDDPEAGANVSYSAETSVEVTDISASLSFEIAGPNIEGVQEQVLSFFSDPEGRTPTAYTVDWGDGQVDSYGQNPDYGGFFGHTYTEASAPGNFTVTEVATLGDEQFTASNEVEIDPLVAGLTVLDPGYADGGQAFYAEAYFLYDQAGNLTGQFPVPNHAATYTVDWGDGSTDTVDSNQFTHTYAFDDSATPTNYYQFTVTATAGEYSSIYTAWAQVLPPDGSGMITAADAPDDITEGTAFTLSGTSFSDEAQSDDGFQGAVMTVWWGDGNSDSLDCTGDDPPAFDPTHVYVEPGSYAVTFAAGYLETNDPGGQTSYIDYTEPFNLTVAEATPTISGEGSPTSLTAGDEYSLAPTYSDSVGDHRIDALTVDWGDGSSSVYEGNIPFIASHMYATAGTFDPSLSLTAYADDGNIIGSAGEVDVGVPTVGITAESATADESGQQPASFEVTRSGAGLDVPLTVNFSLGGTLDANAYLVTDENGMILDGSVTIPAGQNFADILVYPLEDHTPRWTETVDLALTGSDDYAVDDGNSAAGCYVENDDLYAWLDNGSDNDLFEGGLPSDGGTLVPLVLDLPTETRAGAEITLTDNAPTEADVYTMSDPGDSDTPILGNVDGTTVSEVTWTYGVDEDAPSGETTFYVEGISGSASLNDISFEVNDSDANCGPDGTDTNPAAPQDEGGDTYATTTASGPTNAIGDWTAEIIMLNDPNYSGDLLRDISAPPHDIHDWLAGQMVDLEARVIGPAGAAAEATYDWAEPTGNVARAWNRGPGDSSSTIVNLADDDGGGVAGQPAQIHTGLRQATLDFFWISTTASAPLYDPDTVSVSISMPGDTGALVVSTKFDVYEPTVSGAQISVGIPDIDESLRLAGLFKGANDPRGFPHGMVEVATVTVPFGSGTWGFMQTVQSTRTAYYPPSSPLAGTWGWSFPGNVVGLDTSFLLPAISDKYDGAAGWTTGSTQHFQVDSPALALNGETSLSINDTFWTYIMFQPTGLHSQWVPLQMGIWKDTIPTATDGVFGWSGNGWSSVKQFSPVQVEPNWTFKATASMWV